MSELEHHPYSYTRNAGITPGRRAGTLGCYSSHVSALAAFNRTRETEFMLLLEDDVGLSETIFSEDIPAALAQLKGDAVGGRPWHVVRFGIPDFGGLRLLEADRVGSAQPAVYRALEPASTPDGERYMSGAAVLSGTTYYSTPTTYY